MFAPPEVVLQAAVLTAAVVIALTIYAFNTTFDSTVWAPCVMMIIFLP